MARYIDADKFAERIKLSPAFKNMEHEGGLLQRVVLDLLANTPTADVAEVVRCGECKHWKINPNNLYGGYCRYCAGASINHFCSYGKRKGDT